MAKTIRDDLDRPSGRFVRSLALSVGGGALLTFLGAGVAGAQDGGTAGTASDGAGAAKSGDATAVGNRSGTTKTQTATPSGTVGGLQVVDQTAAVANVGVAVANTGGNRATGNSSNNEASAEQTSADALGGATNSGTAANSSNGTATISTGNASAIGNESTTVIDQRATTSGQLGNILVVQQGGFVANAGVALANSGDNTANGNTSFNRAGLIQEAAAAAGLASNSGTAKSTSDGLATIWTGNASATGNHSETRVLQSANGSAGADPGGFGFAYIPQNAVVLNAGAATATTGGNTATGNNSGTFDVPDHVNQNVGDVGTPFGPLGVASNSGEASNWSNGEGSIRTGDAQAVGNDSRTDISQGQQTWLSPDGGVSLAPQVAAVANLGLASASTGGNTATGNNSYNQVEVTQDIPVSGGVDIGVGSNFGQATTASDGTASIVTGDAYSAGNRSRTDVEQNVEANGGFLNLQPQIGLVLNAGVGTASSGGNTATGNNSDNRSSVDQDAELSDDPGIDVGVLGQFGKSSATSGGTAAIETGTASAVGNDSETGLGQTVDPDGLVVNTQLGTILNVGVASANSGGNSATGNNSFGGATLDQDIEIGADNGTSFLLVGTIVGANNGEASTASDGLATIKTGAAAATGNESSTNVRQEANGSIDGAGLVLNTQVAPVLNAGFATADSGNNRATGNNSVNDAEAEQDVFIGSDNGGDVTLLAGIVTASNDGTSSNASDGEANITTGKAAAAGNRSQTVLAQNATGEIDGLGVVVNTQLPFVANVGVGVANSGNNLATGNTSNNQRDGAGLDQAVEIGSDNDDVSLTAAFITGANSGSAENASDGTADIRTGGAQATGNASATHLTQDAAGHAPGLVLDTQLAVVLNAGGALANTGGNSATGNDSTNEASVDQDADVLSNNTGDGTLLVIGPLTAANQGTASSTSDGTAVIKTGQAQAQGNVSSTFLGQGTDPAVAGLGAAISTQVAGVANVGVGVANSGINFATGNESENDAELEQNAEIGSDNDDDPEFTVIGPLTAANSAEASNSSDGRAKVKTGGALATGNASATNLSQHQDDNVNGLGLVVGTQIGGVANVGLGVANSGLNFAIGNTSENDIDDADGGQEAFQDADILSDAADPTDTIIFGGATAVNQLEATNTSDGEACVCTGDAVASGNVSSTTLIQDLNLNVGAGVVVLTEAGGVLNAGIGLANTGLNGAIGNSSDNTSEFTQTTDINDALLPGGFAGPQTAHNGGTASNNSNGKALVASGNASGTGNQSTTDFVQAAQADGGFAFSTLAGGTTNAGLGIANAGLNFGLGNDSTNTATLEQHADGSGIVSNQGEASNDSDGTAIIGNPADCEDEAVPTPEQPGKPGLPRTGAELEVQAAIGLMLLLLGFGLQRRSRSVA